MKPTIKIYPKGKINAKAKISFERIIERLDINRDNFLHENSITCPEYKLSFDLKTENSEILISLLLTFFILFNFLLSYIFQGKNLYTTKQ